MRRPIGSTVWISAFLALALAGTPAFAQRGGRGGGGGGRGGGGHVGGGGGFRGGGGGGFRGGGGGFRGGGATMRAPAMRAPAARAPAMRAPAARTPAMRAPAGRAPAMAARGGNPAAARGVQPNRAAIGGAPGRPAVAARPPAGAAAGRAGANSYRSFGNTRPPIANRNLGNAGPAGINRNPGNPARFTGANRSFGNTAFANGNRINAGNNLNRTTINNNLNRTNINNLNRTNYVANRYGYGGVGGGYGGYHRSYGGYGNYGRGYYGGRGYGYGGRGYGYGGYGLGGLGYGLGGFGYGLGGYGYGGYGYGLNALSFLLGYGLGGFGGFGGYGYGGYGGYGGWGYPSYGYGGYGYGPSYASTLYTYGYSPYTNPYTTIVSSTVDATPFDYTQPINAVSAAPVQSAADDSMSLFGSARDAFKAGDVSQALRQTDAALAKNPDDTSLHEFRALCLFALGRYDEAATPLYAILAVGPGWDWPTLAGIYPSVDVYTTQLRALEAYTRANPQSASARFVLAYHYLTEGHADAAADQLRKVVALKPTDTVSAKILEQLQPPRPAADAQPPRPAAMNAAPANTAMPEGATIAGTWTAHPTADTTVALTIQPGGAFQWQFTEKGQARQFAGTSTFGNGVLTLLGDKMPPLVGQVTWSDASHMTFRAVGDNADASGLSFSK